MGPASNCAINLSGASLEGWTCSSGSRTCLQLYQVDPAGWCSKSPNDGDRDFAASGGLIARCARWAARWPWMTSARHVLVRLCLKNLAAGHGEDRRQLRAEHASDRMSQSIIRAVADIGHQRRLTVVAEWVSSTEMLDIPRRWGVDIRGLRLHRRNRSCSTTAIVADSIRRRRPTDPAAAPGGDHYAALFLMEDSHALFGTYEGTPAPAFTSGNARMFAARHRGLYRWCANCWR